MMPRMRVPVCLLGLLLCGGVASARDLTFEERVALQSSIEHVYYSHQNGASAPFEEAVPSQVLERKVRTYLSQSAALESFWHTPITPEMLRSEAWRMLKSSRQPERLAEIYAAVGSDPFLFEETVVRSVLANRLSRNFFSLDQTIHHDSRALAESIHQDLTSGLLDPLSPHPLRTVIEVRMQSDLALSRTESPVESLGSSIQGQSTHIRLPRDEFDSRSADISDEVGEIGPVLEDGAAFKISIVLEKSSELLRYAQFAVSKLSWDEWWAANAPSLDALPVPAVAEADESLADALSQLAQSVNDGGPETVNEATASAASSCVNNTWNNGSLALPIEARFFSTAVWTGTRMIIWGGFGTQSLNSGGIYDPATDTWAPTSMQNAPLPRWQHTAVWTGSRMIVWGGASDRSGGIYDPLADKWVPTSNTSAPALAFGHTAVWTGSAMVVWGGGDPASPQFSGGRYSPSSNSWLPVATDHAPSPRTGHSAIWTGQEMAVWGGQSLNTLTGQVESTRDGARYDPVSNSWTPMSSIGAPSIRSGHTAVWTGSRMVIWGGVDGSYFPAVGGVYSPGSDTWTETAAAGAPEGRQSHIALWTGTQMIIWGGDNQAHLIDVGGRYDPSANSWQAISTLNAPFHRNNFVAVWTGSLAIVWGGLTDGGTVLSSGGRYDPLLDTWTPTSPNRPFISGPAAVWTGNSMLVWGLSLDSSASIGARYDPAVDAWTPISALGAPPPRGNFTLVWTGSRMLLWGGVYLGDYLNTGGRYDPLTDTWSATSVTNAPSGRWGHSAVWTGTDMIVWGGTSFDFGTRLSTYWNSGGRYDPATDTWAPTSLSGAPTGRFRHTAIWTGHRMVVWGGLDNTNHLNTGGRYDPATDTWAPTSLSGAPTARREHTAIWTGRYMVVWGGVSTTFFSSGGRYEPDSDTWLPTATFGAPTARSSHTAVWTGALMIVWGGRALPLTPLGSRYDPNLDAWSPISEVGAPAKRFGHVAVWTGSVMIVYGGTTGLTLTDSGGRYCTCSGSIGTYYQDVDGDGYGNPAVSVPPCSTIPPGYVPLAGDCNDGDPAIHPGATEQCNGLDDDCNGQVDDALRITCPPDLTRECPAALSDLGTPVVVSSCDPSPVVFHDGPAELPLGTSLITWTAQDALGHTASCSQRVHVADTIPPALSLTVSPSVLWPPNHRIVDIKASVAATDACTTPTVTLTSVISSEPDDAPGPADGSTTEDIQIATTLNFPLRAERDGNGPGRTYLITFTAVDDSGNQAQASATVLVPHDEGGTSEPVLISADSDGVGTVLSWDPVPGARSYRAVRGHIRNLRDAGGSIDLGTASCMPPAGSGATPGREDLETPMLGDVFFYLVSYDNGQDSGYGSDTAMKPRINTGGGCP